VSHVIDGEVLGFSTDQWLHWSGCLGYDDMFHASPLIFGVGFSTGFSSGNGGVAPGGVTLLLWV